MIIVMGWIWKFALFVLVLMGIAIIADIITWFYEYWWIFFAFLGGIFLVRFILRPDFRERVFSFIVGKDYKRTIKLKASNIKSAEEQASPLEVINGLIDLAIVDGVISERERRSIITKGAGMGITPDEVEALIVARLNESRQ